MQGHLEEYVLIAILLLAAASITSIVSKRLKIPYSIALVFVGLLMGIFGLVPEEIHLEEDLVFLLFLPPLLFESAIHIHFPILRGRVKLITLLAIPGVIFSTFIIAYLVSMFTDLPFLTALLFGAVISATDPISVLSIFKELGVGKRLSILVEGESLFNDGTALVLFKILLGMAVAGGAAFSLGGAAVEFAKVAVGGLILGAFLGYAFTKIFERVDDHLVEITITTVLVYGSYALAEQVGVSGVITVVVCGLVIGNYGIKTGMSSTTRVAVESFWEYAAFVVNSVIFILVGREVVEILGDPARLELNIAVVVPAFLVVMLARVVTVLPLGALANALRERVTRSEQAVLIWGGLRGSLPMALVLGLPSDLTGRDTLLIITFGVVFISLVLQGLTIKPLLKKLGLVPVRSDQSKLYDELLAEIIINRRSIRELEFLFQNQHMPLSIFEEKTNRYRQKVDELTERIDGLIARHPEITEEQRRRINLQLLDAQKAALGDALHHDTIGEEVASRYSAILDAKRIDLHEGTPGGDDVSEGDEGDDDV